MAGTDNLRPIKPGEVRNPNGKKKGTKNRSTILKEYLQLRAKGLTFRNMDLGDIPEDMTVEQVMNLKALDAAIGGDLGFYKEIQDTVYGKVKEQVQVENTFKAMGNITVAQKGTDGGAVGPLTELTFNVGNAVRDETTEEDEDDEDTD